jgi:hypothetical protein
MRDAGFQSPLTNLVQYIKDIVEMFVKYQSVADDKIGNITWKEIDSLLMDAYIDIVPIHKLNQTDGVDEEEQTPDYMKRHVEQMIVNVCKGLATYDDIDFSYDRQLLKQTAAARYIEFRALDDSNVEHVNRLQVLLVELFVEDIKNGTVQLMDAMMPAMPPMGEAGLPPVEGSEGAPAPGGDEEGVV